MRVGLPPVVVVVLVPAMLGVGVVLLRRRIERNRRRARIQAELKRPALVLGFGPAVTAAADMERMQQRMTAAMNTTPAEVRDLEAGVLRLAQGGVSYRDVLRKGDTMKEPLDLSAVTAQSIIDHARVNEFLREAGYDPADVKAVTFDGAGFVEVEISLRDESGQFVLDESGTETKTRRERKPWAPGPA